MDSPTQLPPGSPRTAAMATHRHIAQNRNEEREDREQKRSQQGPQKGLGLCQPLMPGFMQPGDDHTAVQAVKVHNETTPCQIVITTKGQAMQTCRRGMSRGASVRATMASGATTYAVAVPEGNTSACLTIMWWRSGGM
jgi:hypothetical protein